MFIAVGTPSRRGDGHADLSFVYAAARQLAPLLSGSTVIVTKSTVPIGTGDEVRRQLLRELRPDIAEAVVSNPEFFREGAAIEDFKHPDRIVVGTNEARARDVLSDLYRPLYINASPIMFTDRRTAEMIKYAADGFLGIQITFMNEVADLCEQVVAMFSRCAGFGSTTAWLDIPARRAGYGGSCFPKDAVALIKTAHAPRHRVAAHRRDRRVGQRPAQAGDGAQGDGRARRLDFRGKTIALLGLTFKPNTDDMREAPVDSLVTALRGPGRQGPRLRYRGMEQAKALMPDITYCDGPYSAADGAPAPGW